MKKAGFIALDFSLYFEPEGGINTPEEFTKELMDWARKEEKHLCILEETMEPIIDLDGEKYVCKLADAEVASQNNPLWKLFCKQGVNHSVGKLLGYKWVYLYKI